MRNILTETGLDEPRVDSHFENTVKNVCSVVIKNCKTNRINNILRENAHQGNRK